MEKPDKALAAAVTARIQTAKAALAANMTLAGLHERDGWRVSEELRSTPTGTLFVFRPVHSRLDSPGFESTVEIDSNGCPV